MKLIPWFFVVFDDLNYLLSAARTNATTSIKRRLTGKGRNLTKRDEYKGEGASCGLGDDLKVDNEQTTKYDNTLVSSQRGEGRRA